jgi:mannose-6-phosphate isomerase-like protein (cupin superfamily)
MSNVINFKEKFTKFSDLWTPKILGQFDNYHLKAAKMKGEFIWHTHDNADELFIVVSGTLKICLRDREITLQPDECFIVPQGVEHKQLPIKKPMFFLSKKQEL